MPTVSIPDIGTVRFPDEMSQEDIVSAIENDIIPRSKPSLRPVLPEPGDPGPQLRQDMPNAGMPTQAFPGRETAFEAGQKAETERLRKFEEDAPWLEQEALVAKNYRDITGRSIEGDPAKPEFPKLKPEDVTGAAEYVGDALGLDIQVPDAAAKGAAGLQQAITGVADFFLTPEGIAMLGMSGASPTTAKVIGKAFSFLMAAESPGQMMEGYRLLKAGDIEGGTRALTSGVIGLGFAGYEARQMFRTPPRALGPTAEPGTNGSGGASDFAKRQHIERIKREGWTPEDLVLFSGVDPKTAGTTVEKVEALAQRLNVPYTRPTPKPPEAPVGETGVEAPPPNVGPEPSVFVEPKSVESITPETAKATTETAAPIQAALTGNQQQAETEAEGKLFRSEEEKQAWVRYRTSELDYEATEPFTPERKEARQRKSDLLEQLPGGFVAPDKDNPLRSTLVFFNEEGTSGGVSSIEGGYLVGDVNQYGIQKVQLPGNKYSWVKIDRLFPEQLAALEQNGKAQQAETQAQEGTSAVSSTQENVSDIIVSDQTGQQKASAIRKLADEAGVSVKDMQERVEAELVNILHNVSLDTSLEPQEKFDKLVDVYEKQPTLSARTSTSVENQAYSTPIPLAYALQHAVWTNPETTQYEPTGGNGALLAGGNLAGAHGNELNELRASAMRKFGVGTVTQNDATVFVPSGKFMQVKANPPFGTIPNVNYKGFGITKLEHLISLKALETMADNGRAALIMGARREPGPGGKGAQWIFENYLYGHYNVVGNFEVAGDLYAKQGAGWPVRVIVIDGRKATPEIGEFSPASVDRLDTWDQVWDKVNQIHDALGEQSKAVVPGRGGRVPVRSGSEPATTEEQPGVSAPAGTSSSPTAGGSEPGGIEIGEPTGEEQPGSGVRGSSAAGPVLESSDSGMPGSPSGSGRVAPERVEGRVSGLPEPAADVGTGPSGTGRTDNAGDLAKQHSVKQPPEVAGTELQDPYLPASKAQPFGTLAPKGIASGMHAYLRQLQAAVGPIDDYVADRLHMDVDKLRRVLAAEQIDGVALAIHQIETGGALVIGDETGIGKGRQAAAIIRYAIINGKIPVFFTKDPKLFSDMYADLLGIDTTVKPLVLGNANKSKIKNMVGDVLVRAYDGQAQKRELARVQAEGLHKAGYDVIFTTYSQVNKRNERQKFLEDLAAENPTILVLDEAHESAGDAETSMQAAFMMGGTVKRGSGANKTTVSVPGLLRAKGTQQGQGGVLYLSATYAKTAENMPVYFRTDLRKASQSFKDIVEALVKGGVAMQQAVAEALAKAGQYIRRERDFSGVRYQMQQVGLETVGQLTEQVDSVTDVLSQITEFSRTLREKLADEGEQSTAMTDEQTDVTDFAAIVHNQIGQLLLAAKANDVVNAAIESKKNGEKPVIALMSTMESFLGYYTTDKGIKPGSPIQIRWNELLKYALSRTLRATTKSPTGDDVIHTINPEDYGMRERFDSIEAAADEINVNFPISPIDYIIQKLNKAGVKTVELTGRTSGIEYTDFDSGEGVYRRFKQANKNDVVNAFNNAVYDGMLLNASGSTGLSAHASTNTGKDHRPRRMLIVQPAADINVFVQTLGRIRRTGMLLTGTYKDTGEKYGAAYTHMVLPLQAELRPAAMAARKLKSLNANTTSGAEGSVKIDSENLMNKYGDEVVAEYLDANQEMQNLTGLYVSVSTEGKLEYKPDLARAFTGRMGLLPDSMQKSAYSQIIPEYRTKIEQLKASGEYDLDVVMHEDWAGKLIESVELSPATDPSSMFTGGTNVQKWEVTDNRHAPGGTEMLEEFTRKLGKASDIQAEWNKYVIDVDSRIEQQRKEYRDQIEAIGEVGPAAEGAELSKEQKAAVIKSQQLKDKLSRLEESAGRWDVLNREIANILGTAGEMVELNNTETGDVFDGMLVDFKKPTGSRVSKSGFRFRFAVNAPGGVVHLTARDIGTKWTIEPSGKDPVDVRPAAKGARYQRFFVTGNPIQGYQSTGGVGKMVRFRAADGQVVTGLMMPHKWSMSRLAEDPRFDLLSGKAALNYLTRYGGAIELGNIVRIAVDPYSSDYVVISVGRGGGKQFYLDPQLRSIVGDFTLRGQRMVADMRENQIESVVDRVMEIASKKFRPASGDKERHMERVADANAGAQPKTLEDSLKDVPKKSKLASDLKEGNEERRKMGVRSVPPIPGIGLGKLFHYVKGLVAGLQGEPGFTPFKQAVNRWFGELQRTSLEVRALQRSIESRVPSKTRRAAITNWIQADGDIALLQTWYSATTNAKLKKEYYAAMNLTPDEISVANAIIKEYERQGTKAQSYELVSKLLDDYVNQVWKRPALGRDQFAQFASKLSNTFKFGQKRVLENFFEGEQLGFKPVTKDISKLLGLYVSELGKVIATRDFLKDLTTKKAADGRPLAAPAGNARFVSGKAGDATLIRPSARGQKTSDYKVLMFPSFNRWKWLGEDPVSGSTIMLQGNLAVHPDVASKIENILGRSAIKRWYESPAGPLGIIPKILVQSVDRFNSVTKQVMLGFFAPFHHVQEATHAVGHRINPLWNLPPLDPNDRQLQRAMDHGLVVAGDKSAMEMFREGLGAQDIFDKIPIVGAWANWWSDMLFNEYIPRLKYKTYRAMVERNRNVFAKELAAGRVTIDDIEYISAMQANAAYGHLNWADMGADPTVLHIARSILLAPDFLAARAQFSGQALKGIPFKSGREQLWAIAFLAAVFWTLARVFNQLIDGDPHFNEPFGVVHNGRRYVMRMIPEDAWRAFNDTRKFIYGRVSPVIGRGAIELLTGRNYRGEKVEASDTFKDLLVSWVPITLRNLPYVRGLSPSQVNNTITAWESFLGSIGIQISRHSPIQKAYGLAGTYMRSSGIEGDRGSYPVSKYQQLRYALEDGDLDKAFAEKRKLLEQMSADKLSKGFKESLFDPWTKNQEMDRKFKNSLTPQNRQLVIEAERKRKEIWNRFQKIHRTAR